MLTLLCRHLLLAAKRFHSLRRNLSNSRNVSSVHNNERNNGGVTEATNALNSADEMDNLSMRRNGSELWSTICQKVL